jgi:glycosyltransferase involved in cell wall biosynthesis
LKFAFLFEKTAEFPPSFDNIKCYYITKEIIRRGGKVSWVQQGRDEGTFDVEGITFVRLRLPTARFLSAVVATLRILIYCLTHEVQFVYIDAWLYLRHSPLRQLTTVLALRIWGIKVVMDQRDPYLDFEVARGTVRPGTIRHKLLSIDEKLTPFVSSVVLLPSKAYERLLLGEGAPADKVAGFFRGIDLDLFNPSVDGEGVRKRLGVEGRFVIGWFGMMHRHLRVREVILPLAQQIGELVPNGYMLIGGKGPLSGDIVSVRGTGPHSRFEYVGLIPYDQLPHYLAACDLLLCPVSTDFRFSRHSNWLKILEGLAVGRPVIATRTESSTSDLSLLRGIVWTGQELGDFKSAIELAYQERSKLLAAAKEQSRHLNAYSISSTIPKIVDRIVSQSSRSPP